MNTIYGSTSHRSYPEYFTFNLSRILLPSFERIGAVSRPVGREPWKRIPVPDRVGLLSVDGVLRSISVYDVSDCIYDQGNLSCKATFVTNITPQDYPAYANCGVGVPLVLAAFMRQHYYCCMPEVPVFGRVTIRGPELLSVPQMLSMFRPQVFDKASEFFEAGADCSASFKQLADNLSASSQKVSNTVTSCSDVVMSAIAPIKNVDIGELFCFLIDLIREIGAPTTMGCFTLGYRLMRHIPDSCLEWLTSHLERIIKFFSQGPAPELDIAGSEIASIPQAEGDVLTDFVAMIGVLCGKCIPTSKDVASVVESCRKLNIVASSAKNVQAFVQWLVGILPECVASWVCILCPAKMWLRRYDELHVGEWLNEVDSFCVEQNKLLVLHDTVRQHQLRALVEHGKEIIKEVSSLGKLPVYASYILKKYDKANDFLNGFLFAAGLLSTNRKVPFTVYLSGAPGVGKSTLMPYLVRLLAPKGLPENLRSYSRTPGEDFWDRYMGQFFCFCDDHNQSVEGKDALELIRMVNSIPYILPMASLGDPVVGVKGTLFTSKVVLITSNQAYPTSNAIHSQEAAWRRRDRLFQVIKKPEYQNLSVDEIPVAITCVFDHLLFQRMHPTQRDVKIGVPISFKDFMTDIKASFDLHERKGSPTDPLYVDALLRQLGFDVPENEEEFHDAVEEIVPDPTWHDQLRNQINEWFNASPFMKVLYDLVTDWRIILTLLVGIYSMYPKKQEVQMICASGGDMRISTSKRFVRRQICNALPQSGIDSIPQVGVDLAGIGLSQIIVDHLYTMYLERPDGSAMSVAAFCVWGRVFVLPKHIFFNPTGSWPQEGTRMVFKHHSGVTIQQNFHINDVISFPSYDSADRLRDLVAFRCTTAAQQKRSRKSMFVSELDLEVLDGSPATMFTCRRGVPNGIVIPRLVVGSSVIRYDVGGAEFAIPRNLEYRVSTSIGDCGGVIFMDRPDMQRRIAGFHLCALNGLAHAEIFTREDLDWLEAQPNWGPQENLVTQIPQCDDSLSSFHPEGNFDLVGVVERRRAVMPSEKTHSKPSLFHAQAYEVDTAPAVLHPRDPRLDPDYFGQSVLRRSAERSATVAHSFDGVYLEQAGAYLDGIFSGGHQLKRILSIEEAINGIPGVPFVESIVMQSSPGYGFKVPGSKGKYHLFSGVVPNMSISSPVLEKACFDRWRNLLDGCVSMTIWQDSLKDECLPLSKIPGGDTRMFSVPPVDHTICVRRLFGGFAAHFYMSCLNTPSTVGIDAESGQWDLLASKLLSKGNLLFDADYKSFGPKVAPEVAFAVCHFINRWYDDGEVNARARLVCFEESVHSLHIAGDALYIGHGGFPSGSPLTIILNTLANMCYIYVMFMEIVPREFRSVRMFIEHLAFFVNGDDCLMSRTPSLAPFFTARAFVECGKTHGLTITPGSKIESDLDRDVSLEEVVYLKRQFRRHRAFPGRYVAVLKERSIHGLFNWIHDSGPELEMSISNIYTALDFAFFYGEEFFVTVRNHALACFLAHDLNIPLPLYSEIHEKFIPKFYGGSENVLFSFDI